MANRYILSLSGGGCALYTILVLMAGGQPLSLRDGDVTTSTKAFESSNKSFMDGGAFFSDSTFVVFLIINVIQVITLLTILIYAVADVYRRCHSTSLGVRSNRVITKGGNRAVAFIGGGAPREAVFNFRKILNPKRLGQLLKNNIGKGKTRRHEKKKQNMLTILKNGHEHSTQRDKFPSPSMRTEESVLFERMGKDPLVYMSAATSKFAREYSPFHARAFIGLAQLNNQMVYPQPIDSGTAFVLPTGHVINKAVGMTDEDLETWNPPPHPNAGQSLTRQCAQADPVHRINVYGFAGSEANKKALETSSVEMLLCHCSTHANLLREPDPSTYSSNPKRIQVDIAQKRVLLPAPGSEPLQSRQVTAAAHVVRGARGEHDLRDKPIDVSHAETAVVFKPVYGSGLVTLPSSGAPLKMNCPCTDRPDGAYTVVKKGDNTEKTILQRDIVGYLNANPMEVSKLTIEGGGEHLKTSWIATGKSVSVITCEGERIKTIK